MRHIFLALMLSGIASPALATHAPEDAHQAPYLDDRSTPQALISSYYNAINRSEYARGWSYFGSAAQPPEGYDAWEFGYSDTYWVDVSFGKIVPEGAAGSIYYSVPVQLTVEATEGQHTYYTGCYTLRLVQPINQTPPFEGMHIESASLREAAEGAKPPVRCD